MALFGYWPGVAYAKADQFALESAFMIQYTFIRLFRWAVNSIGKHTLLTLALLLVVLGSVIVGITQMVNELEYGLLFIFSLLGLLIAWWLAGSQISNWMAGLLVITVGAGSTLVRIGRLDNSLKTISLSLASQAWQGWPRRVDWGTVLAALENFWVDVFTLLNRLYHWAGGIITKGVGFDPVALVLFWSLMFYLIAAWAGWAVRRWNRPLLGVAPAVALLAATLNYSGTDPGILLPIISATLLLKASESFNNRLHRWQKHRVDYSDQLSFDLFTTTIIISVMLTTAAALTPSISIKQITGFAQRFFKNQTGESSGLEKPFRPYTGPVYPGTFSDVLAAGLPRSHLLGTGPELSDQVVMLINVSDLSSAPPELAVDIPTPHYYWRSLTYNRYTGRGWITDKTVTINYIAGEQVHKLGLPAHQLVRLRVQEVEELGGLVHFAGTLISIDQDFQVAWRSLPPIDSDTTSEVATATPVDTPDGKLLDNGSFDVFGAIAEANIYLVDSLVPTVSMAQLRSSGDDYPTWILDRYLTLPNDIPSRVLALARDLTATQPTQYDRAFAIETYLRSYPYTLDISTPPLRKDVVDYFLFELKRGYCDYYATSMVVLARAAGIPARLVVGYATGSYDDQNRRYVVTAADAHSWPEIYFPGYGWIEFEPTAGRPPLERPDKIPQVENVDLDETLEHTFFTSFNLLDGPTLRLALTMITFVLTTLIIGFIVWSLTDTWRLSRVNPTITVSTLYQRLFRNGRRLVVPIQTGDTPLEFADSFSGRINALAEGKRWRNTLTPAAIEVRYLIDLYSQAIYSPNPPGITRQSKAIQTWKRLRWRLWLARLWLGK